MFKRYLTIIVMTISSILISCSHGYLGTRNSSYTEVWSKNLTEQVQSSLGPSYSVNILSGPTSGINLVSTNGITFGTFGKINNNTVWDFAFYFESFNAIDYEYTFSSGAGTGYAAMSMHTFNFGLEYFLGYQITKWFRPYLGIRKDSFIITSGFSSSSVSILYGLGGLAIEVPLSHSLNLLLQGDYGVSLSQQDNVASANKTSLMASLKWGF